MYEKGTTGDNGHRVRLGFITNIRLEEAKQYGRTAPYLTFDFEQMGELNQFEILSSSSELQFVKWEETRTHWAIKNGRIPIDLVKKAAGSTKPPTIEDKGPGHAYSSSRNRRA